MTKELYKFLLSLAKFSGKKGITALVLTIAISLTEGISILMLIPMLKYSGLSEFPENGEIGSNYFIKIAEKTGVEINLVSILIIYIVIVTGFSLLKYFQTMLNGSIEESYTNHLKKKIYSAFTYSEWLYITSVKSSDIIHILTTVPKKAGAATFFLLSFITTSIVTLVHLSIAFFLSAQLSLMTIASGGLIVALMFPLNRKAHTTGKKLFNLNASMFSASTEHISGIKTAKIFRAETQHLDHFFHINNEIKNQKLAFRHLKAKTRMYYEAGAVVLISIFLYTAVKILQIPLVKLFILIFLFARIIPKISSLNQNMQQIISTLPSFIKMREHIKAFNANRETTYDPCGRIDLTQQVTLKNIGFNYGADTILCGIDLTIFKGEVIAITGESGAGKSTLADIIAGLLPCSQGDFFVDNTQIHQGNRALWRKTVSYVNQDPFLFNDTIRQNLLWAKPDTTDDDLIQALKFTAAYEFVMAFEKRADTIIGDRGVKLSGGQKQRIALARAILAKPEILVLDEATSALDTANENLIHQAIDRLKTMTTLIIIAHRASTLKKADRIYVLQNGKLVEQDKSDY